MSGRKTKTKPGSAELFGRDEVAEPETEFERLAREDGQKQDAEHLARAAKLAEIDRRIDELHRERMSLLPSTTHETGESFRSANEASGDIPVLRPMLMFAVPLWIRNLSTCRWSSVLERAQRNGRVVGERGDLISYGAKESDGKGLKLGVGDGFNSLAEGLACLAFRPGGVTFLGEHWEAVHPDAPTDGRAPGEAVDKEAP